MANVNDNGLRRFVGQRTHWRVQLLLLRGAACILAGVALLGLVDLAVQTGRTGRWLGFAFLLSLCCTLAAWSLRLLRRRHTPEALAAFLERTYPELDNRLINFVQFSRDVGAQDLRAEYVRNGAPPLEQLDLRRMKDSRAHHLAGIACTASMILLIAPFFVIGGNWSRALWRSVNPLSSMEPVTLTRILDVEPGNADIAQGESCLLVCRVEGMGGHAVRVEVAPDDSHPATYDLGRIDTAGPQAFSHRIPRANTRFRYRFRAGDAPPSDWYVVTPRPPPALTVLEAVVEPPAYTRAERRTLDLRGDAPPEIPAGARVHLRATGSTPLESLEATVPGHDMAPMLPGKDGWEASFTIAAPGVIRIEGEDRHGQRIQESVAYVFLADHPPVIEVLDPQGRVVLPAGEPPRIEFRVHDDYGLASVHVERVETGRPEDGAAVLDRWDPAGGSLLQQRWSAEADARRSTVAYRIVAVDNRPGTPQTTRSATLVFNRPPAGQQSELRDRLETEGAAGLQQVIQLQESNLEQSLSLRQTTDAGRAGLWREPVERQREIRDLTRRLLQNPVRPLGGRTQAISTLYANEMAQAISVMEQIAMDPAGQQDRRIAQCIALQSGILRALRGAESAAEKAQTDRRKSGIAAMLDALIEGQAGILKKLPSAAADNADVLVDRQDALSEDVGAFEAACLRDAGAVRGNDAAFAELLDTLARESRERKIRQDMLLTSERLEQGRSGEALPLATRAHASLVHLGELLDRVELRREQEERGGMVEALAQAQTKLQRMEEVHKQMQEALDTLRGQADKDSEAFDVLAEEFVEVMKKNKETLVTIPVDLHVFTDLNVGNELVEDVFSVFQEVEQAAESEKLAAAEVVDMAFAKNLEVLELMREMQDRIDDVEMWLAETPEANRVLTEALDREEMPEAGIALGALAAQVEDLIGDLLPQSDPDDGAADDGATTHAAPDMMMGWEVREGDIATFSAKGKSGNEVPDHKEQDGRSNVGRQGMASGETAAGSGTIGEGDKNLEERRTEDPAQSGLVQLEGEADTVATGGGKLGSGKADDVGMEGGVKRFDSTEEGSWEGMAALMAKRADSVFAQASLKNVRVDSLQTAAHHLRQVEDAIGKGDIRQLDEHRRLAVAALQRARIELTARPSRALQMETAPPVLESAVQAGADLAPPKFQSQVADYYKLLNEGF